jgi:hypothetical protein
MSRKMDRKNKPKREYQDTPAIPKAHGDKRHQLPADAKALGFTSMKEYQAFLSDGNYIEHTS